MSLADMFPSKLMIDHFNLRTQEHIQRVSDNMLVVKEYALDLNIPEDEFEKRRLEHDMDKFSKEQYIPYVWLTEFHRCRRIDTPFSYPDGMQELVDSAIKRHYKLNSHHPEHWAYLNNMLNLDLIEMVCDWTAIAQEYNENNGNAGEWARKNIGTKWEFNIRNVLVIGKVLDILAQNSLRHY